jgi:hypothetical protein
MMEAVSTSETSVDNYFTRQYIPEDKSELHTRRRENVKSHAGMRDSTHVFIVLTRGNPGFNCENQQQEQHSQISIQVTVKYGRVPSYK